MWHSEYVLRVLRKLNFVLFAFLFPVVTIWQYVHSLGEELSLISIVTPLAETYP